MNIQNYVKYIYIQVVAKTAIIRPSVHYRIYVILSFSTSLKSYYLRNPKLLQTTFASKSSQS